MGDWPHVLGGEADEAKCVNVDLKGWLSLALFSAGDVCVIVWESEREICVRVCESLREGERKTESARDEGRKIKTKEDMCVTMEV